jgi:hypothetical protein
MLLLEELKELFICCSLYTEQQQLQQKTDDFINCIHYKERTCTHIYIDV